MSLVAQIKFVQGGNIGTPGIALEGTVGTAVTASNGDNSSVARWKWSMIGTPGGSSVPTGLISDGTTPTAVFTPDVTGGYHLELITFDASGAQKIDRRVFQVPELSGRRIAPFDAEAGALNFLGQARGWAPFMEDYCRYLDFFSVGPNVPLGSRSFTQQSSSVAGKAVFADIASYQTPDATPVVVYSYALPAGATVDVVAIIEACESATPENAIFKQGGAFRRVAGGAPSWVGTASADDLGFRPDPGPPFVAAPTWALNGNNLEITVTGTVNAIRWGLTFQASITYEPV
jgi:hypothetical protein